MPRAVDAKVVPETSFAEREAAALTLANGATLRFLRDHLMAMADRHGGHIEADGACHRRLQSGQAALLHAVRDDHSGV